MVKKFKRLILFSVREDKVETIVLRLCCRGERVEHTIVGDDFAGSFKYLNMHSFRHIKKCNGGFFYLIILCRPPYHAKCILLPQTLIKVDSVKMYKYCRSFGFIMGLIYDDLSVI